MAGPKRRRNVPKKLNKTGTPLRSLTTPFSARAASETEKSPAEENDAPRSTRRFCAIPRRSPFPSPTHRAPRTLHSPRRFPPARPLAAAAADRRSSGDDGSENRRALSGTRREIILLPSLAIAIGSLHSAAMAAAEEKPPSAPSPTPAPSPSAEKDNEKEKEKREEEGEIQSRVYDAAVIGEPEAVGKDKRRVWEKLMSARVVYLGEAELVPDRDDRDLELEIVKNLRNRCSELEQQRSISLALEAFPCNLQEQLDLFMDRRIDGASLRSYASHWPPQHWQEYEPLLNYCRDNGIKLVACGTPLEVLRTVQAGGIRGLSKSERKLYAPPAGSGFISGFTSMTGRSLIDKISSNHSRPFGPGSYLSAQARVVDDYTMSQNIMQAIIDGGSSEENQVVILLDPERQEIRREGEIPVADFLWYSAAKTCSRNCFDRAEIARVMNAAGRRREALPQDLQKGLDLGVVSPEILQNFFDLEKYPIVAELIHRFQGFRERLLADPKFLHRLAIEEAISITTTLLAQYERRKGRFFEEIDYVLTDTIRGSVVDFFTVWLPAPLYHSCLMLMIALWKT
uniref:Haem-binding uptake Tiki superfamily ChaN domain-containing protein n=1 Tax=Ananas comosus var. bracteatus TaxID=296719 RepID=A0A6V7NG01_ANACO|nr:unnamed protein product [Ananas comosus var. bracteatus]